MAVLRALVFFLVSAQVNAEPHEISSLLQGMDLEGPEFGKLPQVVALDAETDGVLLLSMGAKRMAMSQEQHDGSDAEELVEERQSLDICDLGGADVDAAFDRFRAEHGRTYEPGSAEFAQRRALFGQHVQRVQDVNCRSASVWRAGINDYADRTPEEKKRLRGYLRAAQGQSLIATPSFLQTAMDEANSSAALPKSVDWRRLPAMAHVNSQGDCGSCWAFAASSVLSAHSQLYEAQSRSFSPQHLVQCVENPHKCGGTGGCDGATADLAFELAMSKGVPLEADYSYAGKAKRCKSYSAAVTAAGYSKVASNDAAALETAVATLGPLAVSVAGGMMQLYGGGIFDSCSNDPIIPSMSGELNHAVVLMGYGVDGGEGYWLVRNSWGESYGEEGYIRITRKNDDKTYEDEHPEKGIACKPYPSTQTVGGECGILFDAVYPTGVSLTSVSV